MFGVLLEITKSSQKYYKMKKKKSKILSMKMQMSFHETLEYGVVSFGLAVRRFSEYDDLSPKLVIVHEPVFKLKAGAQGMDEWTEQ